jgi:hypothetical protein
VIDLAPPLANNNDLFVVHQDYSESIGIHKDDTKVILTRQENLRKSIETESSKPQQQ